MATGAGTAVAKWGNSPALRFPKKVMELADLKEGDSVDFEVEAPGVIVVRATKDVPTLEHLVSRISAENRHSETDWGSRQGREIW